MIVADGLAVTCGAKNLTCIFDMILCTTTVYNLYSKPNGHGRVYWSGDEITIKGFDFQRLRLRLPSYSYFAHQV